MNRILLFLFMLVSVQFAYSQSSTIQGNIVDASKYPAIGATVRVEGTSIATVTDVDGNFKLTNVPKGSKLTITYLGAKPYTVQASDNMRIILEDDATQLNEVVKIGYGSAKAKDLTSPISVVKAEDIASVPATSPMQALQGKVSGVTIINSGTPGDGPTVLIRGKGSFSSASPLYVVDGMFYDNINFLNPSDIQDMSVLKDASAAAIYGVRAANGVVIITTKKGTKKADARITYDGYVGIQKATNVLKMANASQYGQMLMEANFDAYSSKFKNSIDRFGGSYADADFHNWTYGSDTDWYKELLRTAVITNHAINITGGLDKGSYAFGGNFLHQDGIMDVENYYQRSNLRAAFDYDVNSWLKVGYSGVYSKSIQQQPNNTAWQTAFNSPGIFPVYDPTSETSKPEKFTDPGSIGLTQNFYNPRATAFYYNSKNRVTQFLNNFNAQITFVPNMLKFNTNLSLDNSIIQGNVFTPTYYVSSWQQSATTALEKKNTFYYNHIWDNTLTFNKEWKQHSLIAMVGASMREENYRYDWRKAVNVPGEKEEWQYINLGNEEGRTTGDAGTTYRGLSYFTRLNYNYASKYYLMFTFRADGSSKYQERWGYFPSVGASWVISEENFMKNQKVVDYLKLRASWGLLGNDKVAASAGFASIETGNGASGVFGNNTYPGYLNTNSFSWLKWEVVDETNIGFNLATLNNRLSLDLDYFYRLTKNAVISPRLPFENRTLAGNYGTILNQGVDLTANWSDKVGDLKYNIGANLTWMTNKVKDLSGVQRISNGATYNIVGEEMNSFFGYKVVGVYQTAEECAADPIAVANGLEPGDFKYQDVNNDHIIDGNDQQVLGSYNPNLIYGLNIGLEWKNIDFAIATYGQAGAELYNRKRALRTQQSDYNFDAAQFNDRWTGPGSTNSNPSAKALTKGWNINDQRVNSYFVESADFFRIQNVTLGYSFKNIKFGSYTLPSVRLSLTADRPLTLFSAHSFTPEITDANGWDTNVYPLTATYTFGVSIQF